LGRKITSATPIPAQNQAVLEKSARAGKQNAGEDSGDEKDDEYLVSSPMPTAAPMASHQRGFSVRRRRMVK
jgi:hypothetical protein